MWLAGFAAGAAAVDQVPTSTYIAGGIALLSAALAAWLGARGTLRTAEVQREQNFDQRVDARNAYLETRNRELEEELARYREMYVRLRLEVIGAGLNPDELGKPGQPPSAARYRELYEQLRDAVIEAGLDPDALVRGAAG